MLKRKLFGNPSEHIPEKNNNAGPEIPPLNLSIGNFTPSDVSKYFPNVGEPVGISDSFIKIQRDLNRELEALEFRNEQVSYVYNPVEYASIPNDAYVRTFCNAKKRVIFLGMNPGPFGMCQTGVPFGDVAKVKEFLNISGEVRKPPFECPQREILGFDCKRKEESGTRFWGVIEDLFQSAEKFFQCYFVYNYCPLAFLNVTGKNITPRELKDANNRKRLEDICDASFLQVIALLQPEVLVGIGDYAAKRISTILRHNQIPNITVLKLDHPSRRAKGNENWPEKAVQFFTDHNLLPSSS